MGLFDKLFKNEAAKAKPSNISWTALTELEQLDELIDTSKKIPVFIFKHSTRCGISNMVLRVFEANYNFTEEKIKPYFLDLLRYREISNEIASRFGVPHESPQLLVIKQGKVIYHTSHSDISVEKLVGFLS